MNKTKKVAIIGSHGIYANYGGFDLLVNNLCELKKSNISYIVFNSIETEKRDNYPEGIDVVQINLTASGILGVLYDFISIFAATFRADIFLLLGAGGMPLAIFSKIFGKKIIVNVDGIEWKRPGFNSFARWYLSFCFNLSLRFADRIILDNASFQTMLPKNILKKKKYSVIEYGAEIDNTLKITDRVRKKYSFIDSKYFFALGRPIRDNKVAELCDAFSKSKESLVLVSALSRNDYGKRILEKYSKCKNIHIIDGLFNRPELDLIRKSSFAYIHTHTLCGSAPSLIEAIHSDIPILSYDAPQNRVTLNEEGFFYADFNELICLIENQESLDEFRPNLSLKYKYTWKAIVEKYEDTY